jgi:hypothetical protein
LAGGAIGEPAGGLGLGNFIYSALEQAFFTFFSVSMIALARDKFNMPPSKFMQRLFGAAYFVHLFHPFVIQPLALAICRIPIHPIAWMFILTAISVPVTWGIGILIKLIPKIDYVL